MTKDELTMTYVAIDAYIVGIVSLWKAWAQHQKFKHGEIGAQRTETPNLAGSAGVAGIEEPGMNLRGSSPAPSVLGFSLHVVMSKSLSQRVKSGGLVVVCRVSGIET
jgi:hypothetical protein